MAGQSPAYPKHILGERSVEGAILLFRSPASSLAPDHRSGIAQVELQVTTLIEQGGLIRMERHSAHPPKQESQEQGQHDCRNRRRAAHGESDSRYISMLR